MSNCCSLIQIEDKIIDRRILTDCFACDLAICKGACCKAGESGAPLTAQEIETLAEILPALNELLPPAQIRLLEEKDVAYRDIDGDWVTTLINGQECAFSVRNNDCCYTCAIETAYLQKRIAHNCKPISCSLYPIRVKQSGAFTLLRYDIWDICTPAQQRGKREGILIYEFLRAPLTRAFGEDFYTMLCDAAIQLQTK